MDIKASSLLTAMITSYLSVFSVDVNSVNLIVKAHHQLLTCSGGDYRGVSQLFYKLVGEMSVNNKPLGWLEKELYWEAYALRVGNRQKAALHELEANKVVSDGDLDEYNKRITRSGS